jgi:lipopolysaccharide/colanic/teichoic acid biosynthesis glycosyltransferase
VNNKRVFDIICSGCGLVILSPLFVIIGLIIKFTSPGSIFFRQQRVGLNGKLFYMHKFRTMIADAEKKGPKITIGRDSRITRIGYILRKTKLDELPQLIDVFIGNMSLVGPRPEVPEYVALYPQDIKDIVLSVRPGITEWASLEMLDESDILAESSNPKETYVKVIMPKKLEYAVNYVQKHTFLSDMKIIVATIIKIIKR